MWLSSTPVTCIKSQGISVYSDKPDVQTLVGLEDGIVADFTASRITESNVRRIEVTAQNAFIVANLLDCSLEIMRQARFVPGMEHNTTYRQENVVKKVYVPSRMYINEDQTKDGR